jgi:O-antigen/teichoic acid export membrane protein/glycosyltransferase involved in cell wall biosynthesis
MAKPASHWPISVLTSISAVVNMFVPLVLVRLLSPEQIGHYKIFFLYVMMMPAFSFTTGLFSGLGYWAGQGSRGERAIQLSNVMTFLGGVIMALLALAASPLIMKKFDWPFVYALYFSGCVLGSVCLNFMEEATIVTGHVWLGAIYQSTTEILRSIGIVTAALISHDLQVVLFACTVIWLLKTASALVLGYRLKLVRFSFDREIFKSVWRYSLPVSMATFFSFFVKSADQVILSAVITPAAFAFYALGCLQVPPLVIIEHAITRTLVPRLSHAFATGNPAHAAKSYRESVGQLAFLLIPAVTGLIVFARPIITMLFTTQYADSAVYLRWYALSYLLFILPEDAVPRSRGEGRWILKTFMLFFPLPLALCYGLGMKFAAFGALAGMLISGTCMKIYAMRYIRKSTGWQFTDFLPVGDAAISLFVSLVLVAPCLALKPALGGGLKWFLLAGSLFTVLYFPLTLLLRNLVKHHYSEAENRTGHVLLYSQHLAVGGIERMVLALGRAISADPRWKVFVFCHDCEETAAAHTDKTLIGEFLEAGIPVESFKKGPGLSLVALFRLLRNIFRNDIDVIHSHDLGTLIYAVLAKIFSLGKVRLVHTQHSFVHIDSSKKYPLYERIFTSFVDQLTVVNESLVAPYAKIGVPEKRVQVVNNGVKFPPTPFVDRAEKLERRAALIRALDAGERRPLESLAADQWILYLARFHSVKGQREAARLWKSLKPEIRRRTALLLVGPDADPAERDEVLKAFEGAPDRERVIFLKGTSRPHDWLASSDVFLSCSKFEGMPLGPLEAIGSGLPAVLSSIPGHGFLGKVSQQYPLESPDVGGAHVETLIGDSSFGTKGYYAELWKRSEWIREKYSLEEMAKHYARLYAEA